MPAKIGRLPGYYDQVRSPRPDLLLAAGADVGLACLRGLDPLDFDAAQVAEGSQFDKVLQLSQRGAVSSVLAPAVASSTGGPGHAAKLASWRRPPG
jgi:hypothetical protein